MRASRDALCLTIRPLEWHGPIPQPTDVGRIERRQIRDHQRRSPEPISNGPADPYPDFAALNPGYANSNEKITREMS
jgi:hypothetical protein